MPTPPLPKRFQFHLSTAIVLMFVAGFVLSANMSEHKLKVIKIGRSGWKDYFEYGWPFPLLNSTQEYGIEVRYPAQGAFDIRGIILNFQTLLLLLFVVWLLCEWVIPRLREWTRKGA